MITGMVLSGVQFLIRTDGKKQSWIDKSFVNLLRFNTTDREWRQRFSPKPTLTQSTLSKYLLTESNSEGTNEIEFVSLSQITNCKFE